MPHQLSKRSQTGAITDSLDQPAMAIKRKQFPEHSSFSERNGYKDRPVLMQLEHISYDLRLEIFDEVYSFLQGIRLECNDKSCKQLPFLYRGFTYSYVTYVRNVLRKTEKIPRSEVNTDFSSVKNNFKKILLQGNFNSILDCLELMINECLELWEEIAASSSNWEPIPFLPRDEDECKQKMELRIGKNTRFVNRITQLFDEYSAAYQLDTSCRPYYFFPRISKEEGEAIQKSHKTLHQEEMNGATTHLRNSARFIKQNKYADSIRESIHAVGSVAREIDPDSSNTLPKALISLEKHGVLKHKALKEGILKLYAYANDEQGIRHELLDRSTADVGIEEAMFMYGACASFASYLTQKNRQAKAKN